MPDEIVATIGPEIPPGRLDGTGSGYGLAQCATCGRWIDTSCSQCDTSAPSALMSRDEVLSRREELRSQHRRERSWYERGSR